jgi:hypothetical protein
LPWLNPRQPETLEKIISALCYLSVGLIGLLYIILSGKDSNSPFFRFHFLQAILLGILGYLLGWTASAFTSVLGGLLGMFGQAGSVPGHWLSTGIGFLLHNIYLAGLLLLGYGAVWALLGKYAEIPFISNIVRRQIR